MSDDTTGRVNAYWIEAYKESTMTAVINCYGEYLGDVDDGEFWQGNIVYATTRGKAKAAFTMSIMCELTGDFIEATACITTCRLVAKNIEHAPGLEVFCEVEDYDYERLESDNFVVNPQYVKHPIWKIAFERGLCKY
jgi:hypothetical protein